MSPSNLIRNHLVKVGSISIREAMDDYNISGGHLTKIISRFKKEDRLPIATKMLAHPITNRRYARYYLAKQAA